MNSTELSRCNGLPVSAAFRIRDPHQQSAGERPEFLTDICEGGQRQIESFLPQLIADAKQVWRVQRQRPRNGGIYLDTIVK